MKLPLVVDQLSKGVNQPGFPWNQGNCVFHFKTKKFDQENAVVKKLTFVYHPTHPYICIDSLYSCTLCSHVTGVDMTHTEGVRQNHCRGVSRFVISAYTVRAVPIWYRRYVT